MRKYVLLLSFFSPLCLTAQSGSADTIAIREACLNYVEGFYNSDPVRVTKAVHEDLAKRIVLKRPGDPLETMTSAQLINAAKNSKPRRDTNPGEPFEATISIYDIDRNIATAKISTNKMNFFDYVQLGKFGQEWKIVNVLWAFNK